MAIQVYMPKMSDHMEKGEILNWVVKEGDHVVEGQVIVEVMTDKASAELEAPATGILKGIRAGTEKGAEIPVGEIIAFIAQNEEEVPRLPPIGTHETAPSEQEGEKTVHETGGGTNDTTRKAWILGKQHGSDLNEVQVSGNGERMQEEDVPALRSIRKASSQVNASPAARRKAKELGVDLGSVPGTGPGKLVREKDVEKFYSARSAGSEIERHVID